MDLIYADQAQKIDIRLLMAKVLKTGRARDYVVTYDLNMWPPIPGLKPGERGDQLSALITLDRPADGPVTEPLLGQMLMRFFLADGRQTEQMLLLTGLPATARSWRWRTTCPYSRKPVQVVYFSPSAEQFVSRKVAGVKARPAQRSKVARRHLDRMCAIMRELEVEDMPPGILKPLWMTEARFEQLRRELVREYVRYVSPTFGLEVPDFGDPEEDVDWGEAGPEPLPVNDPTSTSMYFRDKDGTLQMKAKFKNRYGLPGNS
jgi:hypothetical protein